MKERQYLRRRNIIRGPDGPQKFPSINKAKKASLEIQLTADGALGRGTLKAVDHRKEVKSA